MKLIFIFVFFVASSFAFPAPQPNTRPVRSAERTELGNLKKFDPAVAAKYLEKFGYISKNRMKNVKVGGLIDIKTFSKAIGEFQRMANLNPTGKLNKETIKMMSMPRCGVEDTMGAFMMGSKVNAANSNFQNKAQRRHAKKMNKARKNRRGKSRSKRYNLEGGRWNKSLLKYHILNYTPDLTRSQVKTAIKDAFNVWANYTTLKFVHTNNPNEADLKIDFVTRDHRDGSPFDGKGGVLAHAFFPSDGRIHFDEEETFTQNGDKGADLFTVAAHEFGHTLGLAHSGVFNSLMGPFYRGYNPNFSLHEDDIAAIQQLYGKKKITDETKKPPVPTTTPRPKVTPKPRMMDAMKICGKQISFDSMHFHHKTGVLYALKGIYYWKIKDNGVVPGYPRRINRYWSGLPGNIDASVYSKITGRTYFFKGSRVWRYDQNRNLERGFPQPVSALGMPANPDAAMQWGRDGRIYVFKNNYFYQFSEYQRYDGVQRYPKVETGRYWNGVPSNMDGAIQWKNGKSYFFKGDKYWRFSGMGRQMDRNYPKSVRKYWIGCNDNTDPAARLQTSKRNKNKKRRHHHKQARNQRGSILGRLHLPRA